MLDTNWHKSSYSGKQGNCVEVRAVVWDGKRIIEVRDSKIGAKSPVLRFTEPEWNAFIGGAKDGEFDLAPAPGDPALGKATV